MPEEERIRELKVRNRRVHLANERTFLAWIRTSIGIMAFGFVVEKFALFLRQLSMYFGALTPPSQHSGYSSFFGALLVALGALMGFLAFIRYKKVEKQIDSDTYKPSIILDLLLLIAILAIAVFLIIYILHNI